jgi:hypothetical protein
MGTSSLEQSRSRIHIYIYSILRESYGLATSKPSRRRPTENYANIAASSSGLRRASFQWHHETLPPQLTVKLSSLRKPVKGPYSSLKPLLSC